MSLAQQVRQYIDERPTLRDAYAMGVVNYTALARRIASELGVAAGDAVVTACRRYEPGFNKDQRLTVQRALEGSRLQVCTRVGMLQFERSWARLGRMAELIDELGDHERIHVLQGWDFIRLVADEAFLDELSPRMQQDAPVVERRGLIELNIKSPSDLEFVPGFIAALTGALAGRGIRIIEATTCGDDHLLLIDEEDLTEAVDQLNRLMRGPV